ncbi:Shikimate kinase [Halomicronema hongdechloris C2206]|uniref:Shikimate kinase n=1 Tax=Halomicronema hongdechloris C2206 TaxID=1641165 RepID=A0A1Z3HIZ2_9CYAN|nr:hypothetical protein [Halomicronema hongdechloris]ASC70268.1 Shikimate kinase [Halomicronema hongdechloris C2206]
MIKTTVTAGIPHLFGFLNGDEEGNSLPMVVSSLKRIVAIGSSCSGKSTLARRLSTRLGLKHIELDELHWQPNWQERDDNEFRSLVATAVADQGLQHQKTLVG